MDRKTTPKKAETVKLVEPTTKPDANDLLNTFLNDNDITLKVSAISDQNSYVPGQGFVLTDKPLLVVSAIYKHV